MGSLGWQYWLVGLLVQLAGARADLDAIYIRTMSRPGAYGLLKTHSSQGSAPLVALAGLYPISVSPSALSSSCAAGKGRGYLPDQVVAS